MIIHHAHTKTIQSNLYTCTKATEHWSIDKWSLCVNHFKQVSRVAFIYKEVFIQRMSLNTGLTVVHSIKVLNYVIASNLSPNNAFLKLLYFVIHTTSLHNYAFIADLVNYK